MKQKEREIQKERVSENQLSESADDYREERYKNKSSNKKNKTNSRRVNWKGGGEDGQRVLRRGGDVWGCRPPHSNE